MNLNEEGVLKAFADKDYKFFISPYSVNIFGIRMKTGTNKFDDYLCVAYYDDKGCFMNHVYLATTEPGDDYMLKPLHKDGTAIMLEGQYRGAYKLLHHRGYPALRQVKPIRFFRDDNKDIEHDLKGVGKFIEEVILANIHHANNSESTPSTYVDKWSAACQVIRKITDWDNFLKLVRVSKDMYGNSFTYTLFNKTDFI